MVRQEDKGAAMSKFEVVSGVGGYSLYLDDTRIAGAKPWGGGYLVKAFGTKEKYVPERTCHVVPMDAAGSPPYRKGDLILNEMSDGCSVCGYPFDTANNGVPNFCENCGAKVVEK